MGVTGSGKSTFISSLVGRDVGIGKGLKSPLIEDTTNVNVYMFEHAGRRVFLIDTPGFDDTFRSDIDVLKDVAFFFSNTYKRDVALAGIVYLHPISHNRFAGSDVRHLSMFRRMCGDDGPDLAMAKDREDELRSTDGFWGLMSSRGSRMMRFQGNEPSALEIVYHLIQMREKKGNFVLTIQKELVDEKKDLDATLAGKELRKEIDKATAQYRKKLDSLKADHDEAMKRRDEEMLKILDGQRREFEEKLAEADQAQEQLRIDMERLSAQKTAEFQRVLAEVERQKKQTEDLLNKKADELKKLHRQREADAAMAREERKHYEQQQQKLWEQVSELKVDKGRAEEQARRFEEAHSDFQNQFHQQAAQYEAQTAALTQQLGQLQRERNSNSIRWGPLAGMLAGIAVVGAGIFTANPAAIGSGVSIAGAMARGLVS
ncbi:hypothetical protein NEMBOFW57_001052 [Staphylotrichum longicolle]|uniref:G domain-containing protein n=1 Tax=Staphylotrichum longicolle TaxID=669026 RepID=A0AAD4F0S2_9PEZI|nr:hypothetical protein NEMBOFW57_001052 [Staphylotrichum longicolle]